MTESQLFVSSCSRREMVRRRHHAGLDGLVGRPGHRTFTACVFLLVALGAFLAGGGGI
jgi:hypothetical protein